MTFADRDPVGGVVIYHLEADPFLHRQAMQVQCDIAVDVAETLVAGIGERAGEIRGHRDPHERRQRRILDEVAHLAHPEPARTERAHRADDRADGPFAVHAEARILKCRDINRRRHVPVRRRPNASLRVLRLARFAGSPGCLRQKHRPRMRRPQRPPASREKFCRRWTVRRRAM